MDAKPKQVEHEIRALLDAMDAQWGEPQFSVKVNNARGILRRRFPRDRSKADMSRERKTA